MAVEELEEQLHSQQEVQKYQQQIADLQQRLSESSSDIVAKRNEITSLEAECQKLVSTNDDGLSDKIDTRRYLLVLLPCGMTCFMKLTQKECYNVNVDL